MKLRIRGDTIRLRLTQAEVAALAANGVVEETTSFGPGTSFGYAVVARGTSLAASLSGSRIEVALPVEAARAWATNEEVGIEGEQAAEGARRLRILVEKDFACLKPRVGEDDTDAFPNPSN